MGDGDRAARIGRLRGLILARMREMAAVIGVRQRSGFAAAAQRIATSGEAIALSGAATQHGGRPRRRRDRGHRGPDAFGCATIIMRSSDCSGQLTALLGTLLVGGPLAAVARADPALSSSRRNAHDTASRLFAMFAGNSDATLLLDPRGQVEAVNVAAKRAARLS